MGNIGCTIIDSYFDTMTGWKPIPSHMNGRRQVIRLTVKPIVRQRFCPEQLAIIGLLVVVSMGCSPKPLANQVAIFVSGDTAGWITPCGCAANQSGGLPRRATLIKSAGRDDQVLLIDAGGSASGTSEYHQIKLGAILQGYRAMGLAVHNIGGPESALSPVELRSVTANTGVTWLSSNLSSQDIDLKKVVILERSGIKIAVAGVVEPSRVSNPAWSANDPVQSILKAFDGVKADIRIVLAYFDESGLKKLAESLPEVDCIIGGPTGQAMTTTIGPTRVLSATNKGKFLAQIDVKRVNQGVEIIRCSLAEVVSTISEDDQQTKNLRGYYESLEKRNFTASEAGIVQAIKNPDANFKIAGTESCIKCHHDDHAQWESSKHHQAWSVLKSKGAHVDPFCQQCHTTGYAIDGGFQGISLTPDRVDVGCENCHGPSHAHVLNPKKKTPFQSREQCLRCHDHENSPEFKHEIFWPKIQHGSIKALLN